MTKDFDIGDKVSIIRHRHGWTDGTIFGVVTHRTRRINGTYFYVVADDENDSTYDVEHSRDLRAS